MNYQLVVSLRGGSQQKDFDAANDEQAIDKVAPLLMDFPIAEQCTLYAHRERRRVRGGTSPLPRRFIVAYRFVTDSAGQVTTYWRRAHLGPWELISGPIDDAPRPAEVDGAPVQEGV